MTPRSLLDTNVLSEPVRKEPDEAVVNKLREHGGELATASVARHEMILGIGLLRSSRKRTAIERYLTEAISAALPILPYDATAAEWHGEQLARPSVSTVTVPVSTRRVG